MSIWKISVLCLLGLGGFLGEAYAQEIKMDYDEQCGCDIFYVDGIETTRDGDLYGFRREDGTVIAPNIYRYVGQFTDGYCRVLLDYGQAGLIDSTGRQVVPCIYDETGYPFEGRVVVMKDDLYGFTDLEGNLVIPLQYLNASDFSEGYAPVVSFIDSFHAAYTFIDTLGHQLFPPQYGNLLPFVGGYAMVGNNQRWGVMDRSGRIVLPIAFEQATTIFGDTLFFAGPASGMALYDARLKPLTDTVYSWSGGMQNGRLPVQRNGKYGFLDRSGREVIPCIYDEVSIFSYSRAKVRLGDHFGIIDTSGAIILPIEYDDNSLKGEKYVYHDSLALVEKNGHYGYVDLNGRIVVPIFLDGAYQYSEGLASVCQNGRWGYIDTRGNIFLPFVFDIASPFHWGRAEVYYNGVVRNVDREGRCVKNCKGIKSWRNKVE